MKASKTVIYSFSVVFSFLVVTLFGVQYARADTTNEYFLEVPSYWGGLHIYGDESYYTRTGNFVEVGLGIHQLLKECVDNGTNPDIHTLTCQNDSYFPGAGYTQNLNDFS